MARGDGLDIEHGRKPKGDRIAWPSIVFTLQRAPHTVEQLAKITDIGQESVHRVLLLLEAEGLATRRRDGHPDVWQWEPDA